MVGNAGGFESRLPDDRDCWPVAAPFDRNAHYMFAVDLEAFRGAQRAGDASGDDLGDRAVFAHKSRSFHAIERRASVVSS